MRKLVVGTRGSALALAQTSIFAAQLRRSVPAVAVELKTITTRGDARQDVPLQEMDGKGVFSLEIEKELLCGNIDLAVHSYKDLPAELSPGCVVGAVLERESPEDILAVAPGLTLGTLRAGSRVGTCSLLRKAQLLRARPDIRPTDVRGNVDTRLAKLDRGEYDALVLALAGLRRLRREDRATQVLEGWYYAPGQGALAVEARDGDEELLDLLRPLEHRPTRTVTDAERAFMRAIRAGCRAPVGVRSGIAGDRMTLSGLVAGPDGEPFITAHVDGPADSAKDLGAELARELAGKGADTVIEGIRGRGR